MALGLSSWLFWPVLTVHALDVTMPQAGAVAARTAAACDIDCEFEGRTATCGKRIMWAADNLFVGVMGRVAACDHALNLVQQQCPICPMCFISDTPCLTNSNNSQAVTTLSSGQRGQPPTSTPKPAVSRSRPVFSTISRTVTATITVPTSTSTSSSTRTITATWTQTQSSTETVTMSTTRTLPPKAAVALTMPFIAVKPVLACDSVCLFGDRLATCIDRILWAASQDFQKEERACELAHNLVLEQCPDTCGLCRFHDVSCQEASPRFSLPYECTAEPEKVWSLEKTDWCCAREGLGCTTTTAPDHMCSKGNAESWSSDKADWCCKHTGIGCTSDRQVAGGQESDQCQLAGVADWESWSEHRKVWCFTHDQHFSRLYACEDNGLLWKTEWHDSKKAWCCYFDFTWRDNKQGWCCEREGRLCDEVFAAPSKSVSQFQLLKLMRFATKKSVTIVALVVMVVGVLIALVVRHHAAADGRDVPPAPSGNGPRGDSPTGVYKVLNRSEMENHKRTGRREGARDMAMASTTGLYFTV